MKIKSFKGRRLLLDLTEEQVAMKADISVDHIKKIEYMEKEIQQLNELYEELTANEN